MPCQKLWPDLFLSQNDKEKCILCVTGLRVKLIKEWSNVYYNIKAFVFEMYKHRASLYDVRNNPK